MATSMVIGTQWGDEGKGKIVDWIAAVSYTHLTLPTILLV